MLHRTIIPIPLLLASVVVSLPAQEDKEKQQEAKQEVPTQTQTGEMTPEPVDPKSYRIGPQDVLYVDVWNERQLSGPVQVRPDGMITARLLDDLQVNGMTPDQLEEKLIQEYSKLVNNPRIQVYVQRVLSKKYLITGTGAARTGEFPLVVPTTILEALVKAGGFTEFANKKRIIIMRGQQQFIFNYNDYIKGKNHDRNIYLENGDLIVVN